MGTEASASDGSPSDDERLAVSTPAAGWVELTAPSREEHLDRIALLLEHLARTRLDKETCEDVKLAVTEIVSNAMEWGNRGDERRNVRVSYGLFAGELVLKIEDEGEGFDPADVPDPTGRPAAMVRERLASGKRVGGFGLLLARKLMDNMIYSERGNCVLLTKSLPRRPDNVVDPTGPRRPDNVVDPTGPGGAETAGPEGA